MTKRTHLIHDYSYELMDSDEFFPIVQEYRSQIFADTFTLRARDYAYSEEEIKKLELLPEGKVDGLANHFLVYQEDVLVGWSSGTQDSSDSYAMVNTGVLPEHQNKGIYTALLTIIIERVRDQGFQKITSAHNATNNSVIIPKLKAGFVISGLELNDAFGTLVRLSYFMNVKRKHMMDMRSGLAKPNREALELIGYSVPELKD